jgi:hypothetical protein
MCLLWSTNCVFISQKKTFFIVIAVKTSNLTCLQIFCYNNICCHLNRMVQYESPVSLYPCTKGTFCISLHHDTTWEPASLFQPSAGRKCCSAEGGFSYWSVPASLKLGYGTKDLHSTENSKQFIVEACEDIDLRRMECRRVLRPCNAFRHRP